MKSAFSISIAKHILRNLEKVLGYDSGALEHNWEAVNSISTTLEMCVDCD